MIDGSENVSVHGIFNWILLLAIFSVITVIGNYIGYKHPITDSLVGMAILSLITLVGVWMERYLPLNISSIIYISVIGIVVALPGMPTSNFVLHYVSQVELLSVVTVFLAYVGIGMGRFKGSYCYYFGYCFNLSWLSCCSSYCFSFNRCSSIIFCDFIHNFFSLFFR